MAPKRSRSRSTKRSKTIKTNDVKKIWPKASFGTGPLWDPFPAKAKALLRYSQVITLDPGLGLPAGNLFRANSIYDPDATGLGHQPYGHDTYQSIYNHYKVVSTVITMTAIGTASGVFGITITDDQQIQGSYDTIRELKTTKMAINSSATFGSKSVTNYYGKKQVFKGDTDSIGALFGANPTEQQYFHCWFEGSTPTNDPGAVSFLITLSYEVDMWELKDLEAS